jgi:hypothetical protein
MHITSRDNALLRQARLVRDGKVDELIFVEGLRLAEEAFNSGLKMSWRKRTALTSQSNNLRKSQTEVHRQVKSFWNRSPTQKRLRVLLYLHNGLQVASIS